MPHPIGVIGGMGPHAGVLLVQRILAATVAVRDQDHLPIALLSYASRIPDRSEFVEGFSPVNPAGAILDVAADLAGLGVQVAGMPCNTAHVPVIFDQIVAGLPGRAPGLRLLNLIDETVAHAAVHLPDVKRVGLLATLGTYRSGIYEKRLEKAGLLPVVPDSEAHELQIHRAIYDPEYGIKAKANPVTDRAIDELSIAIEQLANRGAEAVILGCTEISIAFDDPSSSPLPVIDATTALARALVREKAPSRLRPLA